MSTSINAFINVLDHGFVTYIDHMGSDLMVVNSARVSFNKASELEPGGVLPDKDKKLISYLAKHNHWTPFAHPQITLHIKAPIAIRAQLGKHQVGFVMNEVSRRYVSDTPHIYIPRWRSAPTNGAKQGSTDFISNSFLIEQDYKKAIELSLKSYETLLQDGVAPEQARFVLPQGAYTEWYWTGSLIGYARVCKQRSDSHAQWEVQQYSQAISSIIEPLFPHSWGALFE